MGPVRAKLASIPTCVLRVELYEGLRDAVQAGADQNDVGRRVILPATFSGIHAK